MKKYFFLTFFTLSACGGDTKETSYYAQSDFESGETYFIDNSSEYDYTDIIATGSNMTVYLQSDISSFYLSGSDNFISVSEGIEFSDCLVEGDNNVIETYDDLILDCQVVGEGNVGFN